jgi:hypothetical protein
VITPTIWLSTTNTKPTQPIDPFNTIASPLLSFIISSYGEKKFCHSFPPLATFSVLNRLRDYDNDDKSGPSSFDVALPATINF